MEIGGLVDSQKEESASMPWFRRYDQQEKYPAVGISTPGPPTRIPFAVNHDKP